MNHALPVRVHAKNILFDLDTLFYAYPPGRSTHLFVVEYKNGHLELHIAPVANHSDIVDNRKLISEHIVGGGSMCVLEQEEESICYLGGVSGDFKAVPLEVLERFTPPLMTILEQQSIDCTNFLIDKNTYSLQSFWGMGINGDCR